MPIGTELRQARSRLGLSVEHVSERIQLQLHEIEALESGNYQVLPSGGSLEGIVRAYAHELGLDAEPLVERARLERAAFDGWQTPEDLQAFRTEHLSSPGAPTPGTIDPQPAVVAESRGDRRAGGDRIAFEHARAESPRPLSDADAFSQFSRRRTRRSTRGPGRLALAVVSLLAVTGWSAYLYEFARQTDGSATTQTRTPAADSATADAAPDVQTMTSDAKRNDQATSTNPTSTAGVDRQQQGDVRAPAPDISGSWALTTRVESSSLGRFSGLQLGYELKLRQDGTRVTGSGRKVAENSKDLSGRARTPITVEGAMQDNRLTLSFTERGARRPTRGTLNLLLDDSETMHGRFSSDAARSSGTAEARRVTP